jgi:hypothetical protein
MASPGRNLEKVGVPVRRPKPLPVKLFCGLIGSEDRFAEALTCLELEFGTVDFWSRPAPFDFSDYYRDEMGPDLTRKWMAFTGLKERAYLALAKHIAVGIEERLARHGSRTVNIDPGYIDDAQVVLSTAKNYAHRIYIGMGYYAEPALVYVKGCFRPLEWTYPDYKSPAAIEFFRKARTSYHRELR